MHTHHVTCSELGPGRLGLRARRRGSGRARTLLCVFLLVTATSCDGDGGDATGPEPMVVLSDRIAFTTDRDGNFEIYVMDTDGSNPVGLTDDAAIDYRPAWSPDGTKIAFSSDREGGSLDIWAINADGSGLTRVTGHPASEDDPAWSPDGTKIAFAREGDIYVIDAGGGMDATVVNLTNTAAFESEPTWSP